MVNPQTAATVLDMWMIAEPSTGATEMTDRRVSWAECLFVGLVVFGVIGAGTFSALLTAFIAYVRSGEGLWDIITPRLVLSMAAGTAAAGVLSWRFVVRITQAPRSRGAVAGLIVGLGAHPIGIFLYFAATLVFEPAQIHPYDPLLIAFSVFLVGTIASLLLLGWFSAILGALIGFFTADVLSGVQRKKTLLKGDDTTADLF